MKTTRPLSAVMAIVTLAFFAGITMTGRAVAGEKAYYLYDRIGDLLLISKDKDIYIQSLDGTREFRLTKTRTDFERDAFFSKDGRFVLYELDKSRYFPNGEIVEFEVEHFLQPSDRDDSARQSIDVVLYKDYKEARMKDKDSAVTFLEFLKGEERTGTLPGSLTGRQKDGKTLESKEKTEEKMF